MASDDKNTRTRVRLLSVIEEVLNRSESCFQRNDVFNESRANKKVNRAENLKNENELGFSTKVTQVSASNTF